MNTAVHFLLVLITLANFWCASNGFAPCPSFTSRHYLWRTYSRSADLRTNDVIQLHSIPPPGESFIIILGDDNDERNEEDEVDEDDEDEEEQEEDVYTQAAKEEFEESSSARDSSALTFTSGKLTTLEDWGSALGKLRQRVEDVESGKNQDPSHALFRLMSSQSPNQVIGKFVMSANPQTVQAMSGAVSSLLGGLSSPTAGVETIVKASGEKIGSLCFQLQMTGYLFRNAEYLLALRDLLKLKGKTTMSDYKNAFDRLDTDRSGYIESSEIRGLFDDVYEGKAPQVEINAFMQFFDQNNDGRISWEEFETGLGAAVAIQRDKGDAAAAFLGVDIDEDDDEDDEEDEAIDINADVSGTIEIEMEDGSIVEVDAKDYVDSLKEEALKLKEALRKENQRDKLSQEGPMGMIPNSGASGGGMDITRYIASRQGDVKSLTDGISPEIVETMKRLVDFVLEGGDSGKAKKKELTDTEKAQMEMEIPGSALQQLALWQLVLGYKLREEEATGDYRRLLQ